MPKPFRSAVSGVVFIVVICWSVLFTAGVRAEEVEEDDRLTILITASRFAETVDETLAPVTVITRKEIEEKQASTVEEILRTVPGVSLANSGGVGKLTSLFLRGTNSNHVLVLIDGVKIGSATAGLASFQDLPLDQIEKIEVVRGPRSSLYGSEAIGGVIQIFTRKGGGETRPSFSLGVGSHDARKAHFGLSGGTAGAWYNLSASSYSTDGYDACTGNEISFAGCAVDDETDDDGHKNQSVSFRLGAMPSDVLTLESNFFNSDSKTEFDGSALAGHEAENTTQLTSVKARINASEKWQSELIIAQSKDQSDNFCHKVDRTPMDIANYDVYCDDRSNAPREKISTFDTTRDQATWQNDFSLSAESRLVVGADYFKDRVDGSTAYDVSERSNNGVFAAYRTAIARNDAEFAVRHDNNQQFGGATTGSLGWGREIGDGNRITTSFGSAFAVPTFNDLYYPNSGNRNLKPEQSRSFDFGFSRRAARGRVAFNFYHTQIDDLIDFDPAPQNIDKAEITGVELVGEWKAKQWDLNANLTVQNPKDASGDDNDGNMLARRAKRTLTFDAARQFGRHRFGAELYARSKVYDDAKNTRRIAGFATLNLRGEIRIAPNWSFGVKINNLLDKQHETALHYPQDGINLLATLRYAP